jgi:hypothetical protein
MSLNRCVFLVAFICISLAAHAQLASFEATTTASAEIDGGVAHIDIDLPAVREVLGWDLADDGWSARVVNAATAEEAVAQTYFASGEHGTRATVTWLVPGVQPAGTQVDWQVTLGLPQSDAALDGIAVERREGEIAVRTRWYTVHHDLNAGGLPGTVDFADAGTLPMLINDRLYNEGVGQFYLRYDPAPQVEVLSEGPIEAVIRITARYCLPDGTPAPGDPQATYEFAYSATTPAVRMRAVVTQQGGSPWDQLHVFEMYHKMEQPFFDRVAWAPPLESVEFVDERNTHSLRGKDWGALLTDDVALALLSGDLYGIHTNLSGHGVYVHGPWHTFAGGSTIFEGTLYLGPSGGSAEALAERIDRLSARWDVAVSVPELEAPIAQVREAIAAADGAGGDGAAWLLDVARTLAADAETSATTLSALRDWQAATAAANGALRAAEGATPAATALIALEDDSCVLAGGGTMLRLTRDEEGVRVSQIGRMGDEPSLLLAPGADAGNLWSLTFRRGTLGEQETVVPTTARTVEWDADASADGAEVHLRWLGCTLGEQEDALDVTVTVRMEQESSLAQWTIDWENRAEGFGIWEIDFMRLAGVGPNGEVCTPRKWGQRYDVPLPGGGWRSAYPSGGAFAQMMTWWRDGAGLYYGAHDPDAGVKYLRALNGPGGTVEFGVMTNPAGMGAPSPTGGLGYSIALGTYDGDWFDAGKIYREWALNQFWTRKGPIAQREDVAQWWKDCALSIRPQGDPEWVTEMGTKLQEAFGMEAVMHWYVWHQIPFDNNYPEYFPVKPGFGEAVAALQDVGVHVMPYVNGHLWDTDTASWEAENGRGAAALQPDGSLYIERWSQQEHAVMCRASEQWKDKMIDVASRLAGEYGTDGIYLDQIGAAGPRLCFSEEHGHPVGGGGFWSRGYDALLAEMREVCHAINPRFIITTESHAEPYMAGFDGHLMCNLVGADQVPLYTAIYGGYTQTFGRLGEVSNPVAFRMEHGEAFNFGSIMGRVNSLELLKPENAELLAYLKSLAQIRYDYRDFMAFGEMLRPPVIGGDIPTVTTQWLSKTTEFVTMPAIQASAWRAQDGRVAFFYTNVSDEDVAFEHAIDLLDCGIAQEEGTVDLDTRLTTFNARTEREPELDRAGEGYVVRHTLAPMETMAVVLER